MDKFGHAKLILETIQSLTEIDNETRASTGNQFTASDITDLKKSLRMHMNLVNVGAHDAGFVEQKAPSLDQFYW